MSERIFNVDEIKQIAPRYRGKPENFRADKVGKRNDPPRTRQGQRHGPTSPEVEPPKFLHLNKNPTPPRNESLVSEAIFGVDVTVVPINPRQSFSANYSQLEHISRETFLNYGADNKFLDRQMTAEEFNYYNVSMLWLKLLDVKAKQGRQALTSQEKDIRKATMDIPFNVPLPIYTYLSQIGNVTDKMGKETELEIPDLPITQVGGYGGYHAQHINRQTHNLFEEVPSLGMAADAVMAVADAADYPVQAVRVNLPAGSTITQNLLGYSHYIGPRRQEIKQRLNGQGITNVAFPEYVANTRFNLRYLQSLSDVIGQQETYRVERFVSANLTIAGGETQIIKTHPVEGEGENICWTKTVVQALSAACESTAQMGASYAFGFQLYKEPGDGATHTERATRWSCLQSAQNAEVPWVISPAWAEGRNDRRNLPPGIGTDRFRAISKQQEIALNDIIRRLIISKR